MSAIMRYVIASGLLAAFILTLAAGATPPMALAAGPEGPTTVVLVGSFQSELGCPGDWQPDCPVSALVYDAVDDVWQDTFNVPAGNWEYKVALNGSFIENYGQNAQPNGAYIALNLSEAGSVKFYYDHKTHWITSDQNAVIATVPGTFQSELGCSSGDWMPDCLRSWLQNPDGDDIYEFTTERLPAGDYEAKVALNESWAVNYGLGGVQNGPNVPFTIQNSCALTRFTYDSTTHVLDVQPFVRPQPASVTIAGSFQTEVGCPGDWQPDCAVTNLAYDAEDDVWQATFNIPAGNWAYKAALNGSWVENYGLNAARNGANIPLTLNAPAVVKFYYSHGTYWVTDNHSGPIFTAPGSFQSEMGCSGDWNPSCLRSWLQDPDGDGVYTFATGKLPQGWYEAKVAVGESWAVNYGAGGVQNGANIWFDVPETCAPTHFGLDGGTHILAVENTGSPHPSISIETLVNGIDADEAPGPFVRVGSTLAWTYEVVNSGDVTLTAISVTDDQGLAVTCPKTILHPGEFMTCTAEGTALMGQQVHRGSAVGGTPTDSSVTASDPTYYYGSYAFVSIQALINGFDTGDQHFLARVGDLLHFTYIVVNTGDVALTDITVTDDQNLVVTCPQAALAPGESMTCTAEQTALADYHVHMGRVSGNPPTGLPATASDGAQYLGLESFSILIETLVNGTDADSAPGYLAPVGSSLSFSYLVTNTSDELTLHNIEVNDDQGVTFTCPKTMLRSGESMTCTGDAVALAGQHVHMGSVSASPFVPGSVVTASDPAYYTATFVFTGFFPPVENNGVLNVARAGQTIPLKWRITAADGSPVSNLTDVTVTAVSLACSVGTTTDLTDEYAAGASGLQNLGDGYYQWNWKSPASYANSCKTLLVDIGEGPGFEHTADFQFK